MSENIKVEMISRREAFSLLGLTAALGFAVPITLLTGFDAEARLGFDRCPAPTGGTLGMQRRHRGELVAMSGARSGAPVAMSGARSDAEVAKPRNQSSRGVPEGPEPRRSARVRDARFRGQCGHGTGPKHEPL